MYIHVGGDIILPINRVVGIFPYEEEALPKDTLAFLENQTIQKTCIGNVTDAIKSVVVTNHHVYYSPVSTQTLYKRSNENVLDRLAEDEEGSIG
ncbi:extracellular matrix regulator RemB [Shouchella sp. JSM 1781072]|uniref:extracellular matrix regulator RemB n=1 Tax=Bacillaceae TaxID=186817 RepID=UPI000C06A0ED|nr:MULTISPECIES: extracellular matrix/biofilm biosynthesis regulator RemA family protein [Bacillaceae]UTR06494.1 DUF370 domain-containing protein [Alkalihalobacillus sp. LMS6]